jgi:hypothetical protein
MARRRRARRTHNTLVPRVLRYLWASPNTALGLIGLVVALITGGRARLVAGVIEVEGGLVAWLLARIPFLRGGAAALTLGHVVLGRSKAFNEFLRAHERVHVAQYERWGPLFLPAYFASSLWVLARGGDPYRDNVFEREAFALTSRQTKLTERSELLAGPATRPGSA